MHALPARIVYRNSIALRNLSPRIEQSPVQIQSEQTYRHKERTRYTKGAKSTKRVTNELRAFCASLWPALVILCAPALQQKLGGKRDAKTRIVSCADCSGVGLFDCISTGLQKNQRNSDRVRGDPVSSFNHR